MYAETQIIQTGHNTVIFKFRIIYYAIFWILKHYGCIVLSLLDLYIDFWIHFMNII